MSIVNELQKPLGPLPRWGWAVVAVGGFVAYKFITGQSSSSTGSAATTLPTSTVDPFGDMSGAGGTSGSTGTNTATAGSTDSGNTGGTNAGSSSGTFASSGNGAVSAGTSLVNSAMNPFDNPPATAQILPPSQGSAKTTIAVAKTPAVVTKPVNPHPTSPAIAPTANVASHTLAIPAMTPTHQTSGILASPSLTGNTPKSPTSIVTNNTTGKLTVVPTALANLRGNAAATDVAKATKSTPAPKAAPAPVKPKSNVKPTKL